MIAIPIIIFPLTLALLIFFSYKNNHKDVLKQLTFIREKYHDKILLEKTDVTCETSTSGLKNGKYLFTKCDLIFLENALTIIVSRKIGKQKLYSNLIFIESKIALGHGAIKRFNLHSFNGDVYIEFGESGFTSTNVTVQLKNLTPEEKNLIKIA
ncbi:hypothetical protein [Pedobacter chitinilyticus]|uniref:Uncharacterized protein n=1 Tax=Pedobacter chitinilyticus TaxID=2233776 RepID=A0A443YZS4_9SPHI|nr:hypothetical protein [Pedobacter chitinilyticus]RWU09801.1 hypothetical protein DPV69_00185 [Pedobacter chitinilyticus]